MGWLRSRWTVVALVPAFFVTGFAIVSALAGDPDGVPPAAVEASGDEEGETGAPGTTGASPTSTDAAPAGGGTTTDDSAAGDPSTTSGTGDDGGNGGGGGNWPPAPPPGTIEVDYGRWEGQFEIAASEITPDFALATVNGEFHYLGGMDCQVGRVELRGRFYNRAGRPIGRGLWESIWATGEGGEVPQREPLYLEFYGSVSETAESAFMRFTKVECL